MKNYNFRFNSLPSAEFDLIRIILSYCLMWCLTVRLICFVGIGEPEGAQLLFKKRAINKD